MITYTITGAEQLAAAIRALPREALDRTQLEAEAVEACKPIADAMGAAAPRRRGSYARSFDAQAVRPAQPEQVRILIGPTKRGRGFVGFFLEYGTWKLRARPHIRPTWDSRKDPLIVELRGIVRARLVAAGRRLGFLVREAA